MSVQLYDAHVHLAADPLLAAREEIAEIYTEIGLSNAVIVGTSPEDWDDIVQLATTNERFIPAIGLHPWQANGAPEDWQEKMLGHINSGVRVIGEIGLDQWIEGYDIEKQIDAFRWQLSLAAERNLATTIHYLKAHEPLLEILKSMKLPQRGLKLHAYNGPVDTLKPLLELGAHFSFNAGQLKPSAKRVRELIKIVPEDRLLIETDAPDFLPPAELREFELPDPTLCHPANIRAGYHAIAELRSCSFERLAETIETNFKRYFLDESERT